VDYVVTDSPVMLSVYYTAEIAPAGLAQASKELVGAFYRQAKEDGHEHKHVFLNRSKPYIQEGRFHSETQAKEIDIALRIILKTNGVPFVDSNTDDLSLKLTLEAIA
jgi:hypothetical protein